MLVNGRSKRAAVLANAHQFVVEICEHDGAGWSCEIYDELSSTRETIALCPFGLASKEDAESWAKSKMKAIYGMPFDMEEYE